MTPSPIVALLLVILILGIAALAQSSFGNDSVRVEVESLNLELNFGPPPWIGFPPPGPRVPGNRQAKNLTITT